MRSDGYHHVHVKENTLNFLMYLRKSKIGIFEGIEIDLKWPQQLLILLLKNLKDRQCVNSQVRPHPIFQLLQFQWSRLA